MTQISPLERVKNFPSPCDAVRISLPSVKGKRELRDESRRRRDTKRKEEEEEDEDEEEEEEEEEKEEEEKEASRGNGLAAT